MSRRKDTEYAVYVMASTTGTLYIGVTNDLATRVRQHKQKINSGFTSRYHVTKLVYFEMTPSVEAAIAREKQLKGWKRVKKVALVESANPSWKDLAEEE